MARLTNTHGGQADILRGASLNNFLVGESFLIGRTIDGSEEWDVHSVEALEVVEQPSSNRPARYGLKTYPGDTGERLISLDDATVIRIWRRHPRYPELPDAAMGAALTYCEDLFVLTQMIRASGKSRMPSGLLLYPSTLAPVNLDEDDPETDEHDPFLEQLLRHMETPLRDPNDAAALVPFLWRMDPDEIDKVKLLDFSRPIDALAVELRRESREAFAATIDLPADVLTGKQGLNDWSAWNVDEETFRVHLAPHAELIVDSLTAGYLWPTIETAGFDDPRRYRIWYDATNLITHPNLAENAKAVHGAFAISDATLRDATGFDESDAPDEEEVLRRIEIQRSIRAIENDSPNVPVPGGAENGPPTPSPNGSEPSPEPVLLASVDEPELDEVLSEDESFVDPHTVGLALATIERDLMTRLLVAGDDRMRRALERAGNQIVSTAKRRTKAGQAVRDIVTSTPTNEVAARLGPNLVASLSLTTETLLDGAFDELEARWHLWVEAAQLAAMDIVEAAGLRIDDAERGVLVKRMAEDREAGWAVLSSSLQAEATRRLFLPVEPQSLRAAATPLGEIDDALILQPGALRAALSVAGGGPETSPAASTSSSGAGRGGLLSGQTIRDIFRASAMQEFGWVWLYGSAFTRKTVFVPHQLLDGEPIVSWEDEALRNHGSFPSVDFYHPGDHDGCQCTYGKAGALETDPADPTSTGAQKAWETRRRKAAEKAGRPPPEPEPRPEPRQAPPQPRPRQPTPPRPTPKMTPAQKAAATRRAARASRTDVPTPRSTGETVHGFTQITDPDLLVDVADIVNRPWRPGSRSGIQVWIGRGQTLIVADSRIPQHKLEGAMRILDELVDTYPDRRGTTLNIVDNLSGVHPRAIAFARTGNHYIEMRTKTLERDYNLNVQREGRSGHFAPVALDSAPGHGVDYIVTHEFGHLVDDRSGRHLREVAVPRHLSVSNYGTTNERERYAEAFAEWYLTNGQTPILNARQMAEQYGWKVR